ncbi:hypothetical protein TanjilG_23065 [Lupinus angustifolius]|uniref:Uncharacterized protein n=1 Tax=Lupinus angustifolius TaxID=3871 RepID=A0A1J7GH03_LUPAN|nr:hypothetical protein TanjilG_23065 [Lupinus angustifolius]
MNRLNVRGFFVMIDSENKVDVLKKAVIDGEVYTLRMAEFFGDPFLCCAEGVGLSSKSFLKIATGVGCPW